MTKRILIVEDDSDIAASLKELLEGERYQVTTADNGQTGLEALQESEPDLIMLDLAMPVMDGYAFLNLLRHTADRYVARIPVILITAFIEKTDVRHEVQGILRKPIMIDEMFSMIHKLIGAP